MYDHLNDMNFLTQLDKLNMRVQYAKIVLLSFDEQPIKEIQGTISGGSLSVNGNSAVRRTISLTMLANINNSNIENIENDVSINKKIKILIGYNNPLKKYKKYGDIIWFPCGIFILSSASVSRSTSGWNISISGKDKMSQLDGTVGGTLPVSVIFHEKEIQLEDGDIKTEYPTIFQIIYEAVHHWGGEKPENIIITDLDETIKMLVKYTGSDPIYFNNNFDAFSFVRDDANGFNLSCTKGEDAGYQETDFTYPGELILSAGDTVVTLLDKITKTLSNYEYFYTVDGKFVFQQIKNFLNTGSPLDLLELSPDNYLQSYSNEKYLYSLTDLDTTTSINRNPKYDNIKNDFYVWGTRETSNDVEVGIRYHLAIDKKPIIDYAGQYMWEIKDKKTGLILRYETSYDSKLETIDDDDGLEITCIGKPCGEWREELYRQALNTQLVTGMYDNYCDMELLAEWRNLYDTMKEEWAVTNNWNPDVFYNPGKINYWLDFIDTDAELGKYSISQIGRRTKVINDSKVHSVYNKEVPDIIFIKSLGDGTIDSDLIEHYNTYGQKYFILTEEYYNMFSISTTGVSCFDKIREMMYQNFKFNTSISLTCLPKYYMEPNNIIHIEDRDSGINGNFQITQFSLPLTYNGVMNITATEVLTRI